MTFEQRPVPWVNGEMVVAGDVNRWERGLGSHEGKISTLAGLSGEARRFRALPEETFDALRVALNQNCKYLLNTWIPEKFPGTGAIFLANLGGTGEHQVRHPIVAAFVIGAALKTGTYDAAITGVTAANAQAAVLRLVKGMAVSHRNVTAGGWGNVWQSQLWAAFLAQAAWFVWDDPNLVQTDKDRVGTATTGEAGIFRTTMQPLYWTRYDGVEQYPGDSKAEEVAWIATNEFLVQVVKPTDVAVAAYTAAGHRFAMSAAMMPQDLQTDRAVHGVSLPDKYDGYNLTDEGLVINHDRRHPDYMCALGQLQWEAGVFLAHAGLRIPASTVHNAEKVYRAMVDVELDGQTIYTPDSYLIHYPDGNDWGTERYADKVMLDVQAHCLGLDSLASVPAAEWAALHLSRLTTLQARFTTGQTYASTTEDNYVGAEPWVGWNLAIGMLAATLPATARWTYAAVTGI